MGIYDVIYSVSDGIKSLLTPDLTTVKRASDEACSYTSAVVANIDKVVRVDGIQKLPEYWPNGETRNQIGLFTTTLAKNAGKYVVYEGFKHIPGVTVASKLLSDTMHEVKQEIRKDSMKEMAEMRAKVENLEKDLKKTSSSPPESFNHKGNVSSQSANETGGEKTKDVIYRFMRTEFVGNHMFDDLMVPKIGRMEKKNE